MRRTASAIIDAFFGRNVMNLYPSTSRARAKFVLLLSLIFVLPGCASVYVDGNSPEVPAAQFKTPAVARPTQLFFEFQTKGVSNIAATDLLKAKVQEQIQASGLFSQVSSSPSQGGSTLALTINNIALTDDVSSKAFVAGLTFGLAGQTVADGYDLNLRYFNNEIADKFAVVKQGKHLIYTSIGSSSPPASAIKTGDTSEAVFLMLKQALSRLLNDLSLDPRFN